MSDKVFTLGQPQDRYTILVVVAVFAFFLIRSYLRQAQAVGFTRVLCVSLKLVGFAILAICLLEPLIRGTRPTPGENIFVVMADQSQSLNIKDNDSNLTRGDKLLTLLKGDLPWQVRLEQDFETRRYWIGTRMESVDEFGDSDFQESESRLKTALSTIGRRLKNKPVAGIILFTDGNATDELLPEFDSADLPPIFPVVIGKDEEIVELKIDNMAVTQSNFEAAPVRITAKVHSSRTEPEKVLAELIDEQGQVIDQQEIMVAESEPVTFKIKPDEPGIRFYTVAVSYESDLERAEKGLPLLEGTLTNNSGTVVVDRGGGPYRVLYVSGRPNWEFKFLNRALAEDREVNLVGLLRIAKKKPKFDFRRKGESTTSDFFKGFEKDEEDAEQYFEPVLLRLNTEDENELRGGFPKSAVELFRYDALVCDDVESGYFSAEQMSLIQRFVNERGGGFLMLGGQESFSEGKYSRTPIADLLPVYVDRQRPPSSSEPAVQPTNRNLYRFMLSRTGQLQPWVRLRGTEKEESARLTSMPIFGSVNKVNGIKPGADELAYVGEPDGDTFTALVTQNYGKGRTGALLIGDLWRWGLNRKEGEKDDLASAWRQTTRWLVGDVPRRVEVEVHRSETVQSDYQIKVVVRDEEYQPLDNAEIEVTVQKPDGSIAKVPAQPSDREAGVYLAQFPTLKGGEGNYLATVIAKNPDSTLIEERQAGWVYAPGNEELKKFKPNLEWLSQLAEETGGQVLDPDELNAFVASLPNRKLPKTETAIFPLWHHITFFWIAIICLVSEWGIRRINGLP